MGEPDESADTNVDWEALGPEERRRKAILEFAAFDRREHREVYDALAEAVATRRRPR
jgi:hypothetical protein